jgi:hypothetical protein
MKLNNLKYLQTNLYVTFVRILIQFQFSFIKTRLVGKFGFTDKQQIQIVYKAKLVGDSSTCDSLQAREGDVFVCFQRASKQPVTTKPLQYKLCWVTQTKKPDFEEYEIKLTPPNSDTEVKYTFRGHDELLEFVLKLQNDYQQLKDFRVIHDNHIVTLSEKQGDVWTMAGVIQMFIDKHLYFVGRKYNVQEDGNHAQ